jgi:uncharacterized membrane protein YkvA (DUF1232 family)
MSNRFEFRDPNAVQLPAVMAKNARIVERGFWKKLLKAAGRVPFAEDLAAAYFCVMDPRTPTRVRGVLLAALAWFVIPAAVMPEFLIVFGFTDDAAVAAIAVGVVRRHIREHHYVRARAALEIPEPDLEYG